MAMREWLDSSAGKIAAGILVIAAAIAVFFSVRGLFGPSAEVAQANQRIFIDATNGQSFPHEMRAGQIIPIRTPAGNEAGYPAELCFWTKDGGSKDEPTPVLLNSWVGKPGPTFCPDCGRLVRPHNPRPVDGEKPPPTQTEYRPGRAESQDER